MKIRGTVSDLLVQAWTFYDRGDNEGARERVLGAWVRGMDAFSTEQDARVALGLLRRLGFTTDQPHEWATLPDPLTIYRAGGPGLSWTTERAVAETLARQYDLAPVTMRTIAKSDVLAYIAGYGEAEVIPDDPRKP